jgi:uncharacterized membrane protein YsdA (DUF1294 family)
MNLIIENLFWIYLLIINLLSAVLFSYDKWAAIKNYRRIPEQILHLIELLGGEFSVFLLMYTLRHKNRKLRYYGLTWLIIISHGVIFYFLKQ